MQPDEALLDESTEQPYFQVLSRLFFSIYIAVTLPLRFAFIPEFQIDLYTYATFIVFDILSIIYFITDDIFIFRRATRAEVQPTNTELSFSEADLSNSDAHANRTEILRRNQVVLIISILSSLPFEYVTLALSRKRTLANYFLMNRILRVFFLPNYVEDCSVLLENKGILRNIGMQRAWKLFFVMALAGHWCCCGFFIVAKMEMIHRQGFTWAEELQLIQLNDYGDAIMLVSVPEAYIQALYWAYITMVSILQVVFLRSPATIY